MPVLTEKFMRLVRYPAAQASPDGRTPLVFDGTTFLFIEDRTTLKLRLELTGLPEETDKRHEMLVNLSGYAMGRSLKDAAILSYDTAQKSLFLWQTIENVLDETTFVAEIETFLASAEWWQKRLDDTDTDTHSDTLLSSQMVFFRP